MNWESEGFLLSKRKFRENASIVDVFTEKYGKVTGIIYGGTSRKVRNYLQILNKIFVFYNSKNPNKVGYFKTELVQAISPKYFNDKERTTALLSISSILKSLLPESQPHNFLYQSLLDLMKNYDEKNWYFFYIYWELNLIKQLGFDPNLSSFNKKNLSNESYSEVLIDDTKYKIPNYLITNEVPKLPNKDLIRRSLIFTRSIFLNKFFLQNNLIFPRSRVFLENYFN